MHIELLTLFPCFLSSSLFLHVHRTRSSIILNWNELLANFLYNENCFLCRAHLLL